MGSGAGGGPEGDWRQVSTLIAPAFLDSSSLSHPLAMRRLYGASSYTKEKLNRQNMYNNAEMLGQVSAKNSYETMLTQITPG